MKQVHKREETGKRRGGKGTILDKGMTEGLCELYQDLKEQNWDA